MTANLIRVSLTIDSQITHAYAELTGDFNPIHLDPEFAAQTPMRQCIAHGTMSLGLLWQALFRTFGTAALEQVELDVRFVRPVLVGERIHAGGEPRAGEAGCYNVWVKGEDETVRIAGTVTFQHSEEHS